MNEELYKEFCKYFDRLDKEGIPFGLSDLFRKAKELGLELPEPPEEFKIAN